MTTLLKFALALSLDASKEPPKEFRILPFGETATAHGPVVLDQAGATEVMAAYAATRTEMSMDYEHQALEVPPVKAPASGWFTPEVRADGLYATNVRWTPAAEAHLRAGEYRYFSPALRRDPKNNRVRALVNLALTNLPAIHGLEPLVAANNRPGAPGAPKENPAMKTLLAKLRLPETASEAEALTALSGLEAAHAEAERELLALTDAKTRPEALGKLQAFKASHAQVTALSARVRELEAADTGREVDALVKSAMAEGKLPPKLEKWAREMGGKDIAQLRAYLAEAPKLVTTEAPKAGPGDAEVVALTAADRKAAEQLGMSEADFLAAKKTHTEKRGAKK